MNLALLLLVLLCNSHVESLWTHGAKKCETCKEGYENRGLGFNIGYDHPVTKDCKPTNNSGTLQAIKDWDDVEFLLVNGLSFTNPKAADCPVDDNWETIVVGDGKILKSKSIDKMVTKFSKAQYDQLCCTKDCDPCDGDSMFENIFPSSFRKNADGYCHFIDFERSPGSKHLQRFYGGVRRCRTEHIVTGLGKIEIDNSTIHMTCSGKFWTKICISKSCWHVISMNKFNMTLPKTVTSRKNLVEVKMNCQGKDYLTSFKVEVDNSCGSIDCYFCARNFLNFHCHKHFDIVFLFLMLVFGLVVYLIFHRKLKNKRALWKSKIAKVKRAYDLSTTADSEGEEHEMAETSTLRSGFTSPKFTRKTPKKTVAFTSMLAIIMCLTMVNACDNVYTGSMDCTSDECKHAFDLVLLDKGKACFKLNQNQISLEFDHSTYVAELSTMYYTAEHVSETVSENHCYDTYYCGENSCANTIDTTNEDYVHHVKAKDISLSGCRDGLGGWLAGCWNLRPSCTLWTTSLNSRGTFWDVSRIVSWNKFIKATVCSNDQCKSFILNNHSPSKIELENVNVEIVLLNQNTDFGMEEIFFLMSEQEEGRITRMVSQNGSPRNGEIGQVQCKEEAFNNECVFDRMGVRCVPGKKSVSCTWKEISIKSLSETLPVQRGNFILSSEGGKLVATSLKYDEIHLKVSSTEVLVTKQGSSCKVKGHTVSGCYNCNGGAVLILQVEGTGTLSLESELKSLCQIVGKAEGEAQVHFHTQFKSLKHKISWTCGKESGSFLLSAQLMYNPVVLDGVVYNTTQRALQERSSFDFMSLLSGSFSFSWQRWAYYLIVGVVIFLLIQLIIPIIGALRMIR